MVEVANGSLAHDRTVKVALYARHGIREASIVDLVDRVVEAHADPRDGAYALYERRTSGVLMPRSVPAVAIDIGILLE